MNEHAINRLCKDLLTQNITCRPDAPLAEYTTFRLGGTCPLLIDCCSALALQACIRRLIADNQDFILIGSGSNLLVADAGIPQVIIRFLAQEPGIERDGNRLRISAGTELDAVADYTVRAGLADFVKATGIPGTVGGAVVGNAGAFGWQIADNLVAVTALDRQGNLVEYSRGDIGFSYRDSGLKRNGAIVLAVNVELPAGERDFLVKERKDILHVRKEKHPDISKDCCAGSFFRNVKPSSAAARRQAAGYFLEQAGAKQMQVGGAGVYPKHANIIVKLDTSCTAADVYQLQAQMNAAVQNKFGFGLVPEVRFLGDFNASPTSSDQADNPS